jgi:hypothetical protein
VYRPTFWAHYLDPSVCSTTKRTHLNSDYNMEIGLELGSAVINLGGEHSVM